MLLVYSIFVQIIGQPIYFKHINFHLCYCQQVQQYSYCS